MWGTILCASVHKLAIKSILSAEAESKCVSECQLDGGWRSISSQKCSRATCSSMFSFSVPLICRIEKCPRSHPKTPRALRSRSTRSRPEHENNEPALGVAELVDKRGWKDISEGEIKEKEGEVRNGRRIVRESSGEASKKKPACWLFRNECLVGLSESILAHSMSPE